MSSGHQHARQCAEGLLQVEELERCGGQRRDRVQVAPDRLVQSHHQELRRAPGQCRACDIHHGR